MKTNRTKQFIAFILLAVLAVTLAAPAAEAAVKKVKQQPYTYTYTKTVGKKAAAVKTGTNTLQITSSGYVKFKVPKTKKYTFTYSNLKAVKGFTTNGFSYICVPTKAYGSTYLEKQTFTTTGGKYDTAWYGVPKYASKDKTTTAPLAARSCKLKLKKGTTVYFYIYVGGSATAKLNLKIK